MMYYALIRRKYIEDSIDLDSDSINLLNIKYSSI